MDERHYPAPVILLADAEEWRARSLESIFKPSGCAVLKVYTGKQVVEMIRRVSPDVVIAEHRLIDMTGPELLAEIRASELVRRNTPLFILAATELGRQECLEIFRAGAWGILHPPFDAEQILLRVSTYIAAKQEADAAREESLLDPELGCYNLKGLIRRTEELAADATRSRRPIACVAVGIPKEGQSSAIAALRTLADRLNATIRLSDALASLGTGEFVVIAPGTDDEGAERLAERILAALDPRPGGGAEEEAVRAGIFTTATDETQQIVPIQLLSRARSALRRAQESSDGQRIRQYRRNGS